MATFHRFSGFFFLLATSVAAGMLVSSCGRLKPAPVELRNGGIVCRSAFPHETTLALMEQLTMIRARWYDLLEITPVAGHPPFEVHLINDRKEYEKTAKAYGVPAEYTDGFCHTGTLEMFIYLKPSLSGFRNISTLYHEFTHLALSPRVISATPFKDAVQFPFWFSEGMACVAETATFSAGTAAFHPRNPKRLARLVQLLEKGKSIWEPAVFSPVSARGFSLNDYAIAWGLAAYVTSSPRLASRVADFVRDYPVNAAHMLSDGTFREYFAGRPNDPETWEKRFLSWLEMIR